jgi:hypothetical protein
VSAHLLFEDFLRFVDALAQPGGDPWELYEKHYLARHRAVLTAWWEQCMGLNREVWRERVRRVRPGDYGLLRQVVQDADLPSVARETMARCQKIVPVSPEPDVHLLVGFFSPDAFAFEVEGAWAIGIGMERLSELDSIPILLAHEYAHCYRNRSRRPATLGERMVEEGLAVEMATRAFPEMTAPQHLMVGASQLAAFQEYEDKLWAKVKPLMGSKDEALAAKVLFGRAGPREWPSRAGMYLGWRLAREFVEREPIGFDAPPEQVLRMAPGSS